MKPARFTPFLFAPLLALGACKGKEPSSVTEMPPQTVTAAVVQQREISGGLTASGRLVPREELAVSPDISGYRVKSVLVEEGARVRAGQPLAILDDSLLVSQISQLQATLEQQSVAAAQARDQAQRVDGLENKGVLSQEAIANRRYSARSAQAAQAATRAQLNDLLVRRAHLVIRAPYAGLVTQRVVRPGDTSSPGTSMFTMARGELIELYAEMPESDVARISLGDPAKVTLPSGAAFTGHVRLIGERVDTSTNLVTVRIALPVDASLRQGGFAKAQFQQAISVLAVPEAAVRYDADGASVMAIDKDNRVHRVAVRTGAHANGFVELRQGPSAGSRVAVQGAAFTLDGDKVRLAGGKSQ